jgi:phage-related protein
MDEEEIFDKPKTKPKRVLTEKQKEALARGRAKVKENKEKKLKSSVELKKEQREEKKTLSKRQLKALEQVRKNKILDTWDETKSNILATMPDEDSYNLLNNYLDKLSDEDILDKKVLKNKIGSFAKHLHERTS